MKQEDMNNYIGQSFEELSVEEMETMLGSNGETINSISPIAASAAFSAVMSRAVSILVTVTAKCEK
ncbi:MAG: lichenicidin A2 family type 2 lantibiotic [Lactobacillaceae bacterium]|jgi:type 2 lantibiotic (TIGR03893 family)|nr:lichenicidin A2 family type 2 lantibiotic [Lactobacillaceae bacterium]